VDVSFRNIMDGTDTNTTISKLCRRPTA